MRTYDLGRVLAERDADATLDIELLQRSAAHCLKRPRNGAVRRGGTRNPHTARPFRPLKRIWSSEIRGSRQQEQSVATEKVGNRARGARVDGIHG